MTDTSEQNFALDQGWRAIAWTRDFEHFRAIIQVAPTGECHWRVQRFNDNEAWFGKSPTLSEAHESCMAIVSASPLIIVGVGGPTSSRG